MKRIAQIKTDDSTTDVCGRYPFVSVSSATSAFQRLPFLDVFTNRTNIGWYGENTDQRKNVTTTPLEQPRVSGYIKSSQNIVNGVFVNYKAGTFIELNPGFNSGTNFIAEIDPCVSIVTVIAQKTDDEEFVDFEENKINDIENQEWLKVYPTILPSGNSITIVASESINGVDLMMFNIEGKHVRTFRLNGFEASTKMSVVVDNLTSGVYFLKAKDMERIYSQKIIIQ